MSDRPKLHNLSNLPNLSKISKMSKIPNVLSSIISLRFLIVKKDAAPPRLTRLPGLPNLFMLS